MAASDARPVPIKNTAFRAVFPILDADGDLVTGATGLDSEVSKDQGTFADCTNEATEIATSSGIYYLDLSSTEMNADCVAVIVKTTSSGAKTTVLVFYPEETGDINVDVTAWLGTAPSTPTVAGVPNVNVKTWNDLTTVALPLVPTTAGRTLDVSAGGEAGVDWANVGSPTTTLNLSGTTVKTATDVETDTVDIQSRLPAALVSGRMDSNMQAAANNVITAAVIADSAIDRATFAADTGLQTIRSNTAQAGSGSTITLDASASAVDNFYQGARVYLTGGTAAGQSSLISSYVGSTKVATVTGWATNPDATSTFAIIPNGAVLTRQIYDSNDGQYNTLLIDPSGNVTVGYIGGTVGADLATEIWNRNPNDIGYTTAYTSFGQLAVELPKVPKSDSNVTWNATALASINTQCDTAISDVGLTTTITGRIDVALSTLATASALDAVDNLVDTEIADIQSRLPAALVNGRMASDAVAISGSTTAADNAEKHFSTASGFGELALGTTVATVSSQTDFTLTDGSSDINDVYTGFDVVIRSASTPYNIVRTKCLTYTASTKQITVDVTSSGYTIVVGDEVFIYPRVRISTNSSGAVTISTTSVSSITTGVSSILVGYGLDHLISTSVTGTDIADNSIIAKLVSKSATADWDTYDNSTDSLEALRDRGDAAWVTATGFSTLDAAGVRSAVGLASANLDTQLDALPTNAELATALGTADDAVLASITSAHSTTDGLIITVAGYIDTEVAAIKAKTDLIPANPASTTNITSASGVILAASGLDSITATAPAGVANNFREMVVQLWRRFFKKTTKSSTQILTYADNGTTVVTTQTISSSGSDQTQGAAS